ncbi:hypothetical protein D3C77_300820 [compost metagenome]
MRQSQLNALGNSPGDVLQYGNTYGSRHNVGISYRLSDQSRILAINGGYILDSD